MAGGGAGLSALPSSSPLPSSVHGVELDASAEAEAASGVGVGRGDQRGHLVASSEPSSTSTTSLDE